MLVSVLVTWRYQNSDKHRMVPPFQQQLENYRNSLKMAQKIVEYFNLSNKEKKNMQKNAIETSSKYSFKYVQNIWFKLFKKRSK